MTGSVRFTAAALADLDEAAEWYNKQRPMLGVQFLEAVRETINRIAGNPKVVEPDSIVIAALHHRRDPRLARGRKPGE